jgi:Fur family transcriptional regulator, peroxide stress response regulator
MREKGLRITPQRQAILEYLLSSDEHPSARGILEAVKRKVHRICLSTVYGTLAELTKYNIIKELEFADMENRYEGNLSQHVNLVCVSCGRISDYATAHTIDMEQVRQATQFRSIQSRFELYGVCAACGKK